LRPGSYKLTLSPPVWGLVALVHSISQAAVYQNRS